MIANLTRLIDEQEYTLHNTPQGYTDEGSFMGIARVYRNKGQGLLVLVSVATKNDGHKVLHVSLSRRSRIPSWEDVKRVKNAFIGEDKEAYHVIPSMDDYINMHQFCLHLWHELDETEAANAR